MSDTCSMWNALMGFCNQWAKIQMIWIAEPQSTHLVTQRLSITTNFTNKINLTINELRWIMWIELLKNIKNLGLVGVSKPMKDGWGTKMVKRSKILCHCHKCPPACPRHHYKSTSSEPSTTTAANQNLLNQSTILLVLWAPNKTQQIQQYKTKNSTVLLLQPFLSSLLIRPNLRLSFFVTV